MISYTVGGSPRKTNPEISNKTYWGFKKIFFIIIIILLLCIINYTIHNTGWYVIQTPRPNLTNIIGGIV